VITYMVRTVSFPQGRSAGILRYSPECVEGDSANFAQTEFYEVRLRAARKGRLGARRLNNV